ncbi:kelch-like protein diablo isoform X2 [Anabrus simplex]
MFLGGMKEATERKIVMHGIEFRILKAIIYFLYTTEIEVSEENVFALLEVSDLLQILALRAVCSTFLESTLNATNCLSVYTLAGPRGYHDLEHAAFRYILRNFSAVMAEEEFLHAPLEVLATVLESRLLNVKDEGEVLQGVMKWLKHDPDRVEFVQELASKLKLEHVPMEILLNVKAEPLVANSSLVQLISRTINDVLSWRYDQMGKRILWNSPREQFERNARYSAEQAVILALGGISYDSIWSSVECFTLGYDSWKCVVPSVVPTTGAEHETQVIPTMSVPRYYFAVATLEYEVFVIGGRSEDSVVDLVECYNIQSNEWCELPALPSAVVGAGAAFVDQQLMVVGGEVDGIIDRKAWMYDKIQKSWKTMASMNCCRAYHGVTSIGGYIYAIGGIGGYTIDERTTLADVERYNPQLDQWHMLHPIHEPRARFGCVSINEFIYILGGDDDNGICIKSVERYDTLSNLWHLRAPMHVPRCDFGVAVANGCVYCLGGSDSVHFLNTVDKYNAQTDRWHCMHSMQVTRVRGGGAALYVPQIKRNNS